MNTKLLALSIIGITTVTVTSIASPDRDRNAREPVGERPNPEEIVVEIVADYDVNSDNLITSDELAAAIEGLHEKRVEKMRKIADKLRGGEYSPKARSSRGDRQRPEPTEITAKLLADFDTDGDAALNTEELLGAIDAMYHDGPKRGRGPRPRGMSGHRGGPPADEEV